MSLPDHIRELVARVDTTAICDAHDGDDVRVMSAALRCRSANPLLCGTAVTVRCDGDILGVIQALEAAGPGDVVVVDGGGRETALGGELFARAGINQGIAGIVVDGGYRDLAFIAGCELPVYSRHVSPAAGPAARLATVNAPVTCGGVRVDPGDLVIGDVNGVIVLDPSTAAARLTAAVEVKAVEARVIEALDRGARLRDCLNVDEHTARLARGEVSTLDYVQITSALDSTMPPPQWTEVRGTAKKPPGP